MWKCHHKTHCFEQLMHAQSEITASLKTGGWPHQADLLFSTVFLKGDIASWKNSVVREVSGTHLTFPLTRSTPHLIWLKGHQATLRGAGMILWFS
jgi:hypothetical protein